MIGILNREKGTVKLLPSPMLQMQRSIKALKAKASAPVAESQSKVERAILYMLSLDTREKACPRRGFWI